MRSAVLLLALVASASAIARQQPIDPQIERGRYVVSIAGCNDCHTPGFAPRNGQVEEAQWLTGDALGWRGPWGTTYASNLRLFMQGIDEQQWLRLARTLETRPPMPWFNLRRMSEADLRAMVGGADRSLFDRVFCLDLSQIGDFDLLDDAAIQDALAHPERHGDLVVRVCGYSARFVDLEPQMRREIAGRFQRT